jgi:hypothetical protein
MRTTCQLIDRCAQFAATGFVLASLFGCPNLPIESVSGVEPTTYRGY